MKGQKSESSFFFSIPGRKKTIKTSNKQGCVVLRERNTYSYSILMSEMEKFLFFLPEYDSNIFQRFYTSKEDLQLL